MKIKSMASSTVGTIERTFSSWEMVIKRLMFLLAAMIKQPSAFGKAQTYKQMLNPMNRNI